MTMAQSSYNLLGLVILSNNLTVHVPPGIVWPTNGADGQFHGPQAY
jgi:hypothetical protein